MSRDAHEEAQDNDVRNQFVHDVPPFHLTTPRLAPEDKTAQGWPIETVFSMLKRLIGLSLRARRYHSQCREITLRVITLNVMILLCVSTMFYIEQACPGFAYL